MSNLKKISLLHFGLGNVGRELVKQVFENRERLKKEFAIDLQYAGLFGSQGGFFEQQGFSEKQVEKNLAHLSSPQESNPMKLIKALPKDFLKSVIIIDTTTSDQMYPILLQALKKNASVVLANKRPLAGSLQEFHQLQQEGKGRLFYETTVGAGLPVIKVVKELLATGDEILEINGCFSGTLGFICSSLEEGMPFSQSVVIAKEKGFTEFDPREDLGGADVARKAVILARMIGKKIEMQNLAVVPLYPKAYERYSVSEFIVKTKELDKEYKKSFEDVAKKNMTLRYVASVSAKKCEVKLSEVPKESPLGNLKGADNMIIVKTKRYFERPLVIQGPGAGIAVTAAGVFGDILASAKIL